MKKRFLEVVLVVCLVLTSSIFAFASENQIAYKSVVEKYNVAYDVNLEFVQVASNTDIVTYTRFIESVAKSERETLDFLEKLEARAYKGPMPRATATESSIAASYLSGKGYDVTCTYDVLNGMKTNPRNVKVQPPTSIAISRSYTISSWTSSYYDSGVTLGIRTKGTVYEVYSHGATNAVGGVTVEALF